MTSPRVAAIVILLLSAAILATVFGLEYLGDYQPCEMCWWQRYPYMAAAVLALIGIFAANSAGLSRVIFLLLTLTFLASLGLAAYHAGVEWKFWPGPDACTGADPRFPINNLVTEMQRARLANCDEPALTVFGFSLAAWNAVASLLLMFYSLAAMMRRR